jgi:hypothetical protein
LQPSKQFKIASEPAVTGGVCANAPALLDSMRQGLVPLVRQGPAVDLDAFLLVVMNEYCDGEWQSNQRGPETTREGHRLWMGAGRIGCVCTCE